VVGHSNTLWSPWTPHEIRTCGGGATVGASVVIGAGVVDFVPTDSWFSGSAADDGGFQDQEGD
jgi:hypothetical protein